MPERLPIYELVIDETDGAVGMDYMGLVDYPAHGKAWISFNQAPSTPQVKSHFNEEKRIVKGVAIATDLQIYRRREDGSEYNVVFRKNEVLKLLKLWAKNGYYNNVNLMHDPSQKMEGVYMIEVFLINDKGDNVPEEFKGQNVQPGSLIMSYWVENDDAWKFIKEKGAGFSIEGWFKEIEINIKKMKTKKRSLKGRIKVLMSGIETRKTFDKETMGEAVTVDGLAVFWDGDLEAGKALYIVDEENPEEGILANADTYSWEADGATLVVTVDEAGLITDITEGEGAEEEEELNEEEMNTDQFEAFKAMKDGFDSMLKAQEEKFNAELETRSKAFDELVETIEAQEKALEDLTEVVEQIHEGKESKHLKQQKSPAWRKK